LVVPSSEALASGPALGAPLVSSGGQFCAQAPEQALLPFRSFWKRYSVWDLPSTTILPSELVPVLTVWRVWWVPMRRSRSGSRAPQR
jgi:hypothetical protein